MVWRYVNYSSYLHIWCVINRHSLKSRTYSIDNLFSPFTLFFCFINFKQVLSLTVIHNLIIYNPIFFLCCLLFLYFECATRISKSTTTVRPILIRWFPLLNSRQKCVKYRTVVNISWIRRLTKDWRHVRVYWFPIGVCVRGTSSIGVEWSGNVSAAGSTRWKYGLEPATVVFTDGSTTSTFKVSSVVGDDWGALGPSWKASKASAALICSRSLQCRTGWQ